MAYRFHKNEAVPHAIKRVFAEEIAWAVGRLQHAKNRTEAVHEARKSIKKIRALLGLIRSRLGSSYKTEDRFFRDAGRQLSALRDTAVMLEVFGALAEKHAGTDAGALSEIKGNLERSHRETPPEKQVRSQLVRLFSEARPKADSWPLDDLSLDALMPDLIAVYRRGRKTLKRAHKIDNGVALHDFRKAVKQHWYHMRLLEGVWGVDLKKRTADLRELETCLGEANNLRVLRERIAADVETSRDRHQIREFVALIEEESRDLRKRALEAGQRLYADKACDFGAKLSAHITPVRKRPSTTASHASIAVA